MGLCKIMVKLLLALLVMTSKLACSHFDSNDFCSTHFCGKSATKIVSLLNCSRSVYTSTEHECACWFLSNNFTCYIDRWPTIQVSHYHVENDDIGLTLDSRVSTPNQFENLITKFFNDLDMKSTILFDFTSCSSSLCGDRQSVSVDETVMLDLSNKHRRSKMKFLKLNKCCIRDIKGNFSAVFPEIVELSLNQNYLEVIPTDAFQNLKRIEELDLSCNRIRSVGKDKSIFRGLSSLEVLDLSINNIVSFSKNAFQDLVQLVHLNISKNGIKTLSADLFYRNEALDLIDLSYSNFSDNFVATFHSLINVKVIHLEHCNISVLPTDAFIYNKAYLNLKNNQIRVFSPVVEHLTHVTYLDLSRNCLSEDSDHVTKIRNQSAKIGNQSATRNKITELTCHFCCLNTIEVGKVANWVVSNADFADNPVFQINMNFLERIAHLQNIKLSYDIKTAKRDRSNTNFTAFNQLTINITLTYPLYIQPTSRNPQTQIYVSNYDLLMCDFLTTMMVNRNIIKPLNPETSRSNVNFIFSNFTIANQKYNHSDDALEDLIVSNTVCPFPFYCPQKCTCTTKGLNETVTVNCIGKELVTFPNTEDFETPFILQLANNSIRRLQYNASSQFLTELYLENNEIDSVVNLPIMPNLRTLNLRNNRFKKFSALQPLWAPTSNVVQLSFSGNPWECDCTNGAIQKLLPKHIIADYNETTCRSPSSGRHFYLFNSTPIERCRTNVRDTESSLTEDAQQLLLKILLPVFASLGIMISAGFVVYYRHKEFFKLWLFTRGFCLRFVAETDAGNTKTYDAFVSYSSEDEEWVAIHLVRGLEQETPYFKLCLHNRDWPVGEWIMEQILASVAQSRRTIIVLTENFVKSDWSRLEFMVAYKQAVADGANNVLIVVPDDLPEVVNLSWELKKYITLNTYIKWDDPHFWRKLRSAMPRVTHPLDADDAQQTTTP